MFWLLSMASTLGKNLSKPIKTYQNLSKPIKTYQNLSIPISKPFKKPISNHSKPYIYYYYYNPY